MVAMSARCTQYCDDDIFCDEGDDDDVTPNFAGADWEHGGEEGVL